MALRKILTEGDEQLLKHSRKVEKFDDRLHTLIDDMRETLENSGGVGLAAPQVGILRPRCCAAGCEQGAGGDGRAGKPGSHRAERL